MKYNGRAQRGTHAIALTRRPKSRTSASEFFHLSTDKCDDTIQRFISLFTKRPNSYQRFPGSTELELFCIPYSIRRDRKCSLSLTIFKTVRARASVVGPGNRSAVTPLRWVSTVKSGSWSTTAECIPNKCHCLCTCESCRGSKR